MYKAAFSQDLRHLFQDEKELRPFAALPSRDGVEEIDPPREHFLSRLREPARLRSWEEHVESINSLPLDSVQLLLRSELDEVEVERHPLVAAAIVKTRHDLHFWEPLATLGLTGSFKIHRDALLEDMELLKKHCSPDSSGLIAAWGRAWEELSRTLAKEVVR